MQSKGNLPQKTSFDSTVWFYLNEVLEYTILKNRSVIPWEQGSFGERL